MSVTEQCNFERKVNKGSLRQADGACFPPISCTFFKKPCFCTRYFRTSSILNSPACLHQILKLAPEMSTNAAVAFSVFWGEGGWSDLWAVETLCSSHLIRFLFGSRFNGSSVEPSFSPAPVTQWVNAGLKSHWLMLSDSGWQLQGEYWSFSVGLWWSLCE